jgi:hypothetical protein
LIGHILERFASFLAWLGLLLPLREKAGDEGLVLSRPRLVLYFFMNITLDPHLNLLGRKREPMQQGQI